MNEPIHAPRPRERLAAALWQATTDVSDDALVVCDGRGRVATWSRAAVRLFGRPESRSLGFELSDLFAEHVRDEVGSLVARMLVGERIEHFESEVVRADGMPVPVSVSFCPLAGYGGGPAGLVLARDVTEQRLAQAALAEVEFRLREGEALAHIGSWLWDLRTGVVQWSTEFHRIHGIDPLDFGGTLEAYLDAVHPDDRDGLRAALERSVASGRPCEHDYRVVRADPEIESVRVRAQPTIGSASQVVGLRGVGQLVSRDRLDV